MACMTRRNWLILTALAMEARAIAPALSPPATGSPGKGGGSRNPSSHSTESATGEVHLQVIGIGAKILDPGIFSGFDRVILAGLGGALDPSLSIGDVVVDASAGIIPSPDTPAERTGGGLFRAGKIFASPHLITSVNEKQRIFRESGCVAVDMESGIVRRHCQAAGKELIHIRAISDRADEALPERMATWVDEVGEPKMAKVSADLMFRPGLVPVLMRLQSNSKLALKNLAGVIKLVVGNIPRS